MVLLLFIFFRLGLLVRGRFPDRLDQRLIPIDLFVGNLSPLLIILATCGLTDGNGFAALRVSLLQNAMLIAGLITFIQLYPIGPIGGRLPIVMGTSSGIVPSALIAIVLNILIPADTDSLPA